MSTDIQEVEVASDGVFLPVQSLETVITYNSDGTVNYLEVVYNGSTYRSTMTYTAGVLTTIGSWVKQ